MYIELYPNRGVPRFNMLAYQIGIRFGATRLITKHDIITMCDAFNQDKYSDMRKFGPEPTTDGGIVFRLNYNGGRWRKTVRPHMIGDVRGKWHLIDEPAMTEWQNDCDVVFYEGTKFRTFLESNHGAPIFTPDELKAWEHCFNRIGIVRV